MTSRWAFGLVLIVLAALTAVALLGVVAQDRQQRLRAAGSEGQLIAEVPAARDIDAGALHAPLPAAEVEDLDGDVAQLRAGGRRPTSRRSHPPTAPS